MTAGSDTRNCPIWILKLNDIVGKDLVRWLPKLEFFKDGHCDACQLGKQRKSPFKSKLKTSIDRPLQLLHMDLFGPVNIMSISKKKYCLVIVDDFTRFAWTYFLHSKHKANEIIINRIKKMDNIDPKRKISRIRSENGLNSRILLWKVSVKKKG